MLYFSLLFAAFIFEIRNTLNKLLVFSSIHFCLLQCHFRLTHMRRHLQYTKETISVSLTLQYMSTYCMLRMNEELQTRVNPVDFYRKSYQF